MPRAIFFDILESMICIRVTTLLIIVLAFFFGSHSTFANSHACTDNDGDNHYLATSVDSCACSTTPCDDRDDENEYVNPNVQEGLCLSADRKPVSCTGPNTTSPTWWTLQSGKQYANCADYYADNNPSDSNFTCTQQNTSTVKQFYTCVYSASYQPEELRGMPAYLPTDRMKAVGAVNIDNNQNGEGNKGDSFCPQMGGLVSCGRYADDPVTTDIDESKPCGFCDFFLLFKRIVDWIMLVIIPAVAGLIVVFGGFMLVISRGNPQQSKLGKDAIIYTFIGYAIVLIGWLVLNSALTGIGVQKWTGLVAEEIVLQKTYGKLLWTPETTLDARQKDLVGLVLTISGTGNPALDGQTRTITKIWDENTLGTDYAIDCPDGDLPRDQTGTPSATGTKDCIEVDSPLPNIANADGKIKIGGWWQFACGQ